MNPGQDKETAHPILVFKYGGNAMTQEHLKQEVLENIGSLTGKGYHVVIVHGGGPFIKQALAEVNIESEFIDGLRKTTPRAFEIVEMVLKGKVNGDLVSHMNQLGFSAVGLSGKDGKTVTASKLNHIHKINGSEEVIDLGRVGDVANVDTQLIMTLLKNNFIPVIACIADDDHGVGFNINGDIFAGHIAGALKADQYIVLTDVNGLQKDKDDPETLMKELMLSEIRDLEDNNIIQGGMIPKIDSCRTALKMGVKKARIINGTRPEQILELINNQNIGTTITKILNTTLK